ncbi:unnamed protein product [Rhodiola kirilowii]
MANEAPPPKKDISLPDNNEKQNMSVGSGDAGEGSGKLKGSAPCCHLDSLSADLAQIPSLDTPCSKCQGEYDNWLCLCCKVVLCSRYANKQMLVHYWETGHSLVLDFRSSDRWEWPESRCLWFWCYSCDTSLDAQGTEQLRQVYEACETAYILKYGQAPPSGAIQNSDVIESPSSDEDG